MYTDPSGEFAVLNSKIFQIIYGVLFKLAEDIRNFDMTNTNESVVLSSNYFSAYRGSLVIRHSIPKTRSWGMFRTIFLNRKDSSNKSVQHEWGHNQQERKLGTAMYIIIVALPSIYGYFFTPYEKYYSQPWEYSADILGGVNRKYTYSITEQEAMTYIEKYSKNMLPHPTIQWPW